MKYLVFTLLGCFAASALAADCSNPAGAIPSELLHVYWDARNKMCSNSNCALGKNCVVSVAATSNNKQLVAILSRTKTGVSGFPNCYDGTNDIINQCVYDQHYFNGRWEYGGQTYSLISGLADVTPPPSGCNVAKYCAYTYHNNNCKITTWKGNGQVPNFFECITDLSCNKGAKCINGLCCHVNDLRPAGPALCPTISDLQHCGNFQRTPDSVGNAAWSPPETDIPAGLKCGC